MAITANYYVWDGSSQDDADATWNSATIAYLTIQAALAVAAAGEVVFVASEHVQTQASTLSLTSSGTRANPVIIISVDKDNSDTYLAMIDDASPGKIETTGSSQMGPGVNCVMLGLHWVVGDNLYYNLEAGDYIHFNDTFEVNDDTRVGTSTGDQLVFWKNCHLIQLTSGQITIPERGKFVWFGGTYSWGGSGAVPTELFILTSSNTVRVTGVVFNDLDSGDSLVSINGSSGRVVDAEFVRCVVPAALNALVIGSLDGEAGRLVFRSVTTVSENIINQFKEVYFNGTIDDDTSIYLDATYNGTNGYSALMVSNSDAREWLKPLEFLIGTFYAPTNSTVTIEMVLDDATALNDDDVWLKIVSPDATYGALGNIDIASKMTAITDSPAALTSSSVTWTGTGGFTNEQKRKITEVVGGGQAGGYAVYLCLAKPSISLYVDPKITIA